MEPITKNRGETFQATLNELNGTDPADVLSGSWSCLDPSIATIDAATGAGQVLSSVGVAAAQARIVFTGTALSNDGTTHKPFTSDPGIVNVPALTPPDDFHGTVDFT